MAAHKNTNIFFDTYHQGRFSHASKSEASLASLWPCHSAITRASTPFEGIHVGRTKFSAALIQERTRAGPEAGACPWPDGRAQTDLRDRSTG